MDILTAQSATTQANLQSDVMPASEGISSLSWVLDEIRHALEESDRHLADQLAAGDDDTSMINAARHWLHQASGALIMLELDLVSDLVSHIAGLLTRVQDREIEMSADLVSVVGRAYHALCEYLQELADGAPEQPIHLYPYQRAILKLSGESVAHPSDFLTMDATGFERLEFEPVLGGQTDEKTNAALRAGFEAGLLALLRSPDDAKAAAKIESVCELVAGTSDGVDHQRFWYLVGAWIRGISAGKITLDAAGKRLLTRLNSLIRLAVSGDADYPDSIQRDVLFCLACAKPGSAEIDRIHQWFDLGGKVSRDYETPRYGMLDRRAIAEGLAAVEEMKSSWEVMLQQPGGAETHLGQFKQGLSHFQDATEALDEPGLSRMTGAWIGVVKTMGLESGPVSDALGVEVAVSLLFVEQLFSGGFGELDDIDARCSEMARRIDATLHDVEVSEETPGWLCELSAAVHERLTMGAFVVETRAAIREAEGALDSWSRDSEATDGIAGAVANFRQVSGVLRLFDYQQAADAASYIADEVTRLSETEGADFSTQDELADSIGNLGFFVDGMAGSTDRLKNFVFDAKTGAFHFDPHSATRGVIADASSDEVADDHASQTNSPDGDTQEEHEVESKIDEELLEIFLAEAHEVLGQLDELSVALSANRASQSVLTDVRRAFHTLKGSSRMVGLDSFGEPGWAMEELMNHWLSTGEPASDALMTLIADSKQEFAGWVSALEETPSHVIDGADLIGRANALRLGESGASRAYGADQAAEVPGTTGARPATDPVAQLGDKQPVQQLLEPVESEQSSLQQDAALFSLDLSFDDSTDQPDPGEKEASEPRFEPESPAVQKADDGIQPQPVIEPESGGVLPSVETLTAPMSAAPTEYLDFESLTLDADLASTDAEEGQDTILPAVELSEADDHSPDDVEIDAEVQTDGLSNRALATSLDSLSTEDFALSDNTLETPDSMEAVEVQFDEFEAALAEQPGSVDTTETVDAVDQVESVDSVESVESVTLDESEEQFVQIGELSVNQALFDVFVSEADQIRGELLADASDWHKDPARSASEAALRGLHSLKGSAALVQAEPGRTLAHHLEEFLLAQSTTGRNASLADVTEYGRLLQVMFGSFRDFGREIFPEPQDEEVAAAEQLAKTWQTASPAMAGAGAAKPAAPVTSAAAPVDILDEFDAELLPLFIAEAEEYLPRIDQNLRSWQGDPGNLEIKQLLMRELHTVKGSARMAGAMILGQRVHEMETRVEQAIASGDNPDGLIEELIAEQDVVSEQFSSIRISGVTSQPVPSADARDDRAGAVEPVASTNAETASESQSASAGRGGTNLSANRTATATSALVRVRAEAIEKMVNEAGEVSITRARLDNSVGELRQVLAELTENVNRLRTQLRELEIQSDVEIQANESTVPAVSSEKGDFDVLEFDRYTRFQELTRMLAESVNDVSTVQQNASRYLDDAGQDLSRQATSMRQLQYHLMSIRMVQFGSISDRLYRVVRQSAKALGKRVSLDILGSESEVDRNILETMVAPLEHLLRNSVSHGIEMPVDRASAGKAEKGELSIDIRHDGNEIVLTLSDDGAGLQYNRIRERGISAGLIGDADDLSDGALAELIFKPGFSTATTIDQISGRGVGMDVVRAEVLGLGGRIEVFSTAGQGTKFVIHLPLTMAISQVMVAGVGDSSFAVPAAGVEKVLQLKPEELTAAYEARAIQWADEAVPLYYLASLVDLPSQNPVAQPFSPVMIVRSGGRRIAVHADTVSKAQEVVVKNPGPQVARVDGVAGATVMGNGEVVLIINPAQLADNVSDTQLDAAMQAGMAAQLSDVPALVMVVDDSVTVRKVTQRLLVREGFDVLLAKDGVDALRQLQDQRPAIMLVDVEMPRMDGFDLTRAVRKESQYADIPIVMITSRTADKHKKFALSLGVNEFLGKPYIETNLIEIINTYLGSASNDTGVSQAGGPDQDAEPLH